MAAYQWAGDLLQTTYKCGYSSMKIEMTTMNHSAIGISKQSVNLVSIFHSFSCKNSSVNKFSYSK
jgi:hypothetical protein